MNIADIKQQFTQYYATFDTDRTQLASFFNEQSQLNFESETTITGRDAILAKFAALPFQKVQHVPTTIDVQIAGDAIMIVVNGQLKADEDKPMGFSETFLLRSQGQGMFIANDIFRLSVHNF